MFQVLRNAWKIADLRKKILYTLLIILIFRIGSYVSVPFVDMEIMKNAVASSAGGYMDYLTLLSAADFPTPAFSPCPSPLTSTPASSFSC